MAPIRVHFDGKVFVPDEPVDLPAGTSLLVRLAQADSDIATTAIPSMTDHPLLDLFEIAREFPESDLPTDAAAQHDHYLYGHPKRP